jgi:long-chain fatty acid transport protein
LFFFGETITENAILFPFLNEQTKLQMKISAVRLGLVVGALLLSSASVFAQGVMLRSVGSANGAVGSVATAMPLNASGAIFWNPATISALQHNEIEIGAELIQPHSSTAMSIPAMGLTDYRKSEAGITPVPSMSFVWKRCPKSPLTFGVGVAGVGGASSLYHYKGLDPTDPDTLLNRATSGLADSILAKSSNVIVMQITPTVSYQITNKLSVGVAPIIDLASLSINPMSLGGEVEHPLETYGTKYAWGGGFQIGTFYDFKNHFKAGFMFKSPIWAEDIYFTGVSDGTPAQRSFDLNLPTTISMGLSYDGLKNTVVGIDVRYFDYAHAAGFKKGLNHTTGVTTGGVVEGLDWDSVWSVALGAEHRLTQKTKLRMGYCWNKNPIPSRSAMLNVSAPLMMEHVLSFGVGYEIQKNLEFSLSYIHAFETESTGAAATAPTTITVTNKVSGDTVGAGISKKW